MTAAFPVAPRQVALVGGALAALLTTIFSPEFILLPSRFIRRLLLSHRRRHTLPVELTEQQLELLKGNECLFSKRELELLQQLIEGGQGHTVAFWSVVGTNDNAKKRLVRQLCKLDDGYPGGLLAYIRSARQLLEAERAGNNPYKGMRPSVPSGVTLSVMAGTGRFQEYEAKGLEAAKHTAFALVAGGLGERLGYHGIKVSLPSETATETCFLELYIHTILALQRRSHAQKRLPLAIMTSDDTHTPTEMLLRANNYFGAHPSQVVLMKQQKVACLADNAAHLAMDAEDPYCVQEKPHGHGDIHMLLHRQGLPKKWIKSGFKWIAFFQDTNALVFRGLLPTLGVSEEKGWDMNSLAVPRVAKEAIGALCRLDGERGEAMTVNVEYNQLDSLLRSSGFPDGDVNGPNGLSPFPGNINQLVLKLEAYAAQLETTGGAIKEFVNPKYKDAGRTVFKKPTRLECMMQDWAKEIPAPAPVGFTTVSEVWASYSPVKNSPEEARLKAAADAPTHSATQAELDIYRSNARLLTKTGAAIAGPVDAEFNGLRFPLGPAIVLAPSFALGLADLEQRFELPEAVKVSAQSSMVLEGDIRVKALDVDGALIVRVATGASLCLERLVVRNGGWQLVPIAEDSDEPEHLRIRGFRTSRAHGLYIHVSAGDVSVDTDVGEDACITYHPEARRSAWDPLCATQRS